MAVVMLHSRRTSALHVGQYDDRQHEHDERLAGLQGPGPHQPHAEERGEKPPNSPPFVPRPNSHLVDVSIWVGDLLWSRCPVVLDSAVDRLVKNVFCQIPGLATCKV